MQLATTSEARVSLPIDAADAAFSNIERKIEEARATKEAIASERAPLAFRGVQGDVDAKRRTPGRMTKRERSHTERSE